MAESPTARRASSFGAVAEEYDRFRPAPPRSAVEWILRSTCRTAIDLGAGTGALTRELAQRVERVLALEPDARMLVVLGRNSPHLPAVRSRAEELPVRTGTLDAALVSSAWHWMDPDLTIAEVGRALRSGGTFGVIWNGPDRSVEWVAEVLGQRDPSPGDRKDRGSRHRFELPPDSVFTDLETTVIGWSKGLTRTELVGLAGTYSSMITMPPDEREEEAARIRAIAGSLGGGEVVEVPMSCRCWRAVRG
jgi:SAM-dependent methyltransferase